MPWIKGAKTKKSRIVATYFIYIFPMHINITLFKQKIQFALRTILMALLIASCNQTKKNGSQKVPAYEELQSNFSAPPQETDPWAYWYWVNNFVSKEGITKDLEAMANQGIGAALIGNIYLNDIPVEGKVTMLSEQWLELTQHAIREAGRLGIDIGLFNSPGWSQSGGPWNTASNTMRYLSPQEHHVSGPGKINLDLGKPNNEFEDVALLAFPSTTKSNEEQPVFEIIENSTGNPITLLDKDKSTEFSFDGHTEISLTLRADRKVSLNSLKLHPSESTYIMDCEFLAKIDGQWEKLRSFKFDRSNDMDQIGFTKYPPVAVSIPETKAQEFKFSFTNILQIGPREAGLAEIELSESPILEYFIEKSLGKMHQTPLPLGDAYKWPKQNEPEDKGGVVDLGQIIDLTIKITKEGTLNWDVPEGDWTIIRMGMVPTGVTNAPAAKNASGFEVDKINKDALKLHFDSFFGKIMNSMPESERKALKYLVADSYETGGQNWTDDMEVPFMEAFGYSPIPYLPVITGRIVGSVEESNRFLWDLRRFVADRVAYEYVGGLQEICHENGLKLWLENYGHWGFPSEFLKYGGQSDLIGGEFWNEGDLGSIECKAASSSAHIYGKQLVSAEAFTSAGRTFVRHPAMLKKKGDWSYTEGINHFVLHVYIHQPTDEMIPGVNALFGTEFNRHNTWFNQSADYLNYLRKSQYLLQQGKYVADVCYFIGEDAPIMTGVRNPELPSGYSYDYINAEIIMDSLTVKGGQFELPNGTSYKLMVLPPSDTMRPELLAKIESLIKDGGNVLGGPPTKSPSLQNFPKADRLVDELANQIWGDKNNGIWSYGKGNVAKGISVQETLNAIGVEKDVDFEKIVPVLWTHRSLPIGEVYFLTNQSEEVLKFSASFRVKGLNPQLWDAVTGEIRPLNEFTFENCRTSLPMTMQPLQSWFVVFTDGPQNFESPRYQNNFPNYQTVQEFEGSWIVDFENKDIGPKKAMEFQSLLDWTQHSNDSIKYYSGKARYTKEFNFNKTVEGKRLFLDLGKVGVIASVNINGKDIRSTWIAPYRLDITDELKEGKNKLDITVVNVWRNRLTGDKLLPKSEQYTSLLIDEVIKEEELVPSGLMGPVTIQSIDLLPEKD